MATWVRVPVNIDGAGSGGRCTNVWTIGIPDGSAGGGQPFAAAMTNLKQFYQDLSPLYASAAQISAETGYVYEDDVLTSLVLIPWGEPVDGDAPGALAAPDGLSMVVRWRTSLPGRSGRGRTFIGPLGSTIAATGGEPSPANLLILSDAAQGLVAASAADTGWDLQIYSPTDGVSREVIAADVNSEFGYLRSRRT